MKSKQEHMLPNGLKFRINLIDKMDTDFVKKKNKERSSVANIIKKLHIQKNMHLIYKQDYYKYKQEEIYDLFIEYLVSIMNDIDHPALIEEWKQNIDAADYGKKTKPICKDTIN